MISHYDSISFKKTIYRSKINVMYAFTILYGPLFTCHHLCVSIHLNWSNQLQQITTKRCVDYRKSLKLIQFFSNITIKSPSLLFAHVQILPNIAVSL